MKCPNCNYSLEAHTSIGDAAKPEHGDYSICINCTEYLKFDQDLHLVKATDAEVKKDPELYAVLSSVRHRILSNHRN